MASTAKIDLEKIERVLHAWTKLRADKTFAGLTCDQYRAEVQPSLDVRSEMAEAELKVKSCGARRITVDKHSLQVTARVINAVKSDPGEGEDSDLYEAMGYVRKSNRSSGLTRRRNGDAVAAATPTGVEAETKKASS